ncbi:MAG: DoxX family protein [Gammaproteobacteria bacterium]
MIDNHNVLYAALALRLGLGLMWIAHALLKLLVFTLPGTVRFFASVGLPGFLAYPVFAAELIGGAAIIVGFHGHRVSLALLPILLGAAWVHFPNGWVFSNVGGGWEYPVFLVLASVVHGLLGDGAWVWRGVFLRPRGLVRA